MTEPRPEIEPEDSVEELIRKTREGDGAAAAELVRRFEPLLRVKIRTWLRQHPEMRRLIDSADICQSVLSQLLLRVAAGQYDLDRPEQVRNLLLAMARRRVGKHHSRLSTRKRDVGRDVGLDPQTIAGNAGESPAQQAEDRELLALILERLTPEERLLVELRSEGRPWSEIAERLGGTAEARRKQWMRTVRILAQELDADEQPGVA